MRNKIDNLILINMIWFMIASVGNILHIALLIFVAVAGAFCTVIYEYVLTRKVFQVVDEQYQPRLQKRIGFNLLFTLVFLVCTILDFFL